jgi:predicted CoA-substrate-specific enzyme activase
MIFAGIDAGSRTVKVVLLDDQACVLASIVRDQGADQAKIIDAALTETLDFAKAKRSDVGAVVATGYGRSRVAGAAKTATEITCQAYGVRRLVPTASTIIDIGGQDCKAILLEADGNVRDFVMNDRCAAGSGRFLEVAAQRLGVPIHYNAVGMKPVTINSTCVVFAETEITNLLASGEVPERILAGIKKSIASRVAVMATPLAREPVLLTGGGALIEGMAQAIEESLHVTVSVVPQPQTTAALGAAMMATKI